MIGRRSYEAARVADALRRELLKSGESFVFETVFSDPARDKVGFLEEAVRKGYIVVLCYVGSFNQSEILVSAHSHDGNQSKDRQTNEAENRPHDPMDVIEIAVPRLAFD
jgi:hypothetical protein